MAPNRGENRARDFEDLIEAVPKDFDPEADIDAESDSEDVLDDDTQREDVRSHYVDVGKSKLRKPKVAALGPQYRGLRIDRNALENDDDDNEDDPFSRGFEDESSENEDEDDGSFDEDDRAEEQDGQGDNDTPDTDMSEDVSEDEEEEAEVNQSSAVDKAELRKIMAQEQKAVAASISQATKLDAEKGRAVKKQRKAFDGLLSTRIKLQKALVGVNNIAAVANQESLSAAPQVIEAAEAAAFSLWSTLNAFREELVAAKSGEKRKHDQINPTATTDELWSILQDQETAATIRHEANLQKWSAKTRGTSATPAKSRINNTGAQATIIDVVREHLSNSDRLMKRAHTPRSCAPLQLEKKIETDEKIYDDADFYGLLLKELLEQKRQDTVMTSNVDLSFQLRREAKTKKNVDRRASKGRKLRYTVHEKLQNFMAPEDRCSWGDRQSGELFGSLFGQKLGLGEAEEVADEDMAGSEIDPQDAGLMLFGR